MMKCFARAVLLVVLVAPTAAFASKERTAQVHLNGWHTFRSKKLGIAFRYPASWRLTPGVGPGMAQQVMVSAPSRNALTASIVPIRSASSLSATVKRFVAYQRKT